MNPMTIQDAMDICLERIDYRGEVRDKNFAPDLTHFSRHDMFVEAMGHLYICLPKVEVKRPEEDRPRGKTWYYRCANVDEYDDEDKGNFDKDIFYREIDIRLSKLAEQDPRKVIL